MSTALLNLHELAFMRLTKRDNNMNHNHSQTWQIEEATYSSSSRGVQGHGKVKLYSIATLQKIVEAPASSDLVWLWLCKLY